MLCGAPSAARAWVSPVRANLVAQYADAFGPAAAASDGRDVDDGAATGCPHVREGGLAEQERRGQVHRHHPLPIRHRQLLRRAGRIGRCGVDQHPRRSGAGDDSLGGRHYSIRIGQVGGQGESGATRVADAGGHAVKAGLAPGQQRHPRPQFRQPHGGGLTKPAAGPCDDRHLAF
jgi:hypothetical protein